MMLLSLVLLFLLIAIVASSTFDVEGGVVAACLGLQWPRAFAKSFQAGGLFLEVRLYQLLLLLHVLLRWCLVKV